MLTYGLSEVDCTYIINLNSNSFCFAILHTSTVAFSIAISKID
jgi:hypothetical protein